MTVLHGGVHAASFGASTPTMQFAGPLSTMADGTPHHHTVALLSVYIPPRLAPGLSLVGACSTHLSPRHWRPASLSTHLSFTQTSHLHHSSHSAHSGWNSLTSLSLSLL